MTETQKDYIAVILRVRCYKQVKQLKNQAKTYYTYRATIPRETAEKLGLQDDELVLCLVKRPEWYHIIDWTDKDNQKHLWPKLPDRAKQELCQLGLAPKHLCTDMKTPP
ncbi:MAG: hypothetical protein GXO43_05975 [Crenarchaeota archaeon]|nr:hypothetical protein [Thermoproteota archaeon]